MYIPFWCLITICIILLLIISQLVAQYNEYKEKFVRTYLALGEARNDFERVAHLVAITRFRLQEELPIEVKNNLIENDSFHKRFKWLEDDSWSTWTTLDLHSHIFPQIKEEINEHLVKYDYAIEEAALLRTHHIKYDYIEKIRNKISQESNIE